MATTANLGRVVFAAVVASAALFGGVAASDGSSVAAADGAAATGGSAVAADGSALAVDEGAPAAGGGAAVQEDCSFPVTETDATGTEVTIDEEPDRVVTLAPSAAQTMWEIGAREKVVGVSQFASYLEGAESRTNVSAAGPNTFVSVEKVVAAEPDLVLAPNAVPDEEVRGLRDAGLTVYNFRPTGTVDAIREKTLLTGRLVGACEGARGTADWMDREMSIVEEAVAGEDRPRVLYVFFGFTAGEGTFVDHVITAAGGTNVAAEANISGFQQISDEVVADRDPEYIVLNSGNPTVPRRAAYNGTTAVREDNVVVVDENHVSQPAPRVVLVVRQLARAFHPEAYERAAATPTPTASPTPSPTATPTATATPTPEPVDDTPTATEPDESPTPTTGDTPGFGVLAALVALLVGGGLARRA